ncbi:cell division protein DivIC [Lactobacillus colini]|uniref:Cell division protein DivIC n=1 Tax=Lactobacillus colini TaxID=1819254 RepID=A0ABS4MCA2_9LACO|nr:septum formation initiator family protein [Lactobacillus colini]MBP2057281.1 cell division protein DivIC [Lactobacillus colini]
MRRGPRIYNGPSDQEKMAHLQRQAAKRVREVHRRRRTWLLLGFFGLLLILGMQLVKTESRTQQLHQQVAKSKAELTQVNKTNKRLKGQAEDLKDPDYVAKWIRYKLYYSKKGETIYNVPESQDDD